MTIAHNDSQLLPLASFISVLHSMEEEFGAVRAAFIFNDEGDPLGVLSSIESDESLNDIVERTINEVKAGRQGRFRGATQVALAATNQPDPTCGYDVSANAALADMRQRFRQAKLQLTYWVETCGDEIRIPETVLDGL